MKMTNTNFEPKDSKRMTPKFICAWCPDFDPTHPDNRGASHVMCPTCAAKMNAELDRREVEMAKDESGRILGPMPPSLRPPGPWNSNRDYRK